MQADWTVLEWLRRYLDEKETAFKNFAKVVRELEQAAKSEVSDG